MLWVGGCACLPASQRILEVCSEVHSDQFKTELRFLIEAHISGTIILSNSILGLSQEKQECPSIPRKIGSSHETIAVSSEAPGRRAMAVLL